MSLDPILSAAHELQQFCASKQWQFCFIGGIAVQRWGEPRADKLSALQKSQLLQHAHLNGVDDGFAGEDGADDDDGVACCKEFF